MKAFNFYYSLISFAFFSSVVPLENGKMELDLSEMDTKVENHDISSWESGSRNTELSNAIVSGLASTRIKTNLVVQPRTTVLNFKFYKYITQYIKTIQGLDTVRLANIIIHYQPYSDDCKGTVSYALVDTRFNDMMDAESHAVRDNKKNVAKVIGKVKHLVTVDCAKEAFIQFSMNHQVATSDINKMQLCQIVSNIDMIKGKFAKVNLGWLTVPGDSTIYETFPAQLYYFPRKTLPELQGKSSAYSYRQFVRMAKAKYDKEVAMLNKLQQLVDSQNVITNNLESDVINEISKTESEIKKIQGELETMEKVLPNKSKLNEMKKHLAELEKIKQENMKQILNEKNEFINEITNEDKFYINDNNSVDFSKIND
ncbi:movement protein [Arceuthobium sichuanense virus 1]|uniref:Movement protein n=1 Tax=Arceuthobium sichuanense-associated virus 1 TaxID=3070160 RepID=A0AA48SF35_9VIRU|nr:movement protein [Arceuthobium sichuanense virus 1]DAZ87275.1 TPA_asm: movement protein [Arceuthobium sichuanense-associated virus 1]